MFNQVVYIDCKTNIFLNQNTTTLFHKEMISEMDKHYKNWLIQAPTGLVLIGLGVCLIAESAMFKASGVVTWKWVVAGTVSLSVFNAGLCIFGNSIVEKIRHERIQEQNKRNNQ